MNERNPYQSPEHQAHDDARVPSELRWIPLAVSGGCAAAFAALTFWACSFRMEWRELAPAAFTAALAGGLAFALFWYRTRDALAGLDVVDGKRRELLETVQAARENKPIVATDATEPPQ